MDYYRSIFYYSLFTGLVLIFAFCYGRKTKKWRWSEYFFVAIAPLAGALSVAYFEGLKVLAYFFICGIVGSIGELILGLFCEKVLGRKLWFYTKLPLLGGHTSLLNFPFWAGGGMLFFLLAKIFM